MKILLTGNTGQVGWELERSLMTLGTVITAGRSGADMTMDLSQPDAVRAVVRSVRPDLIVNPAAYTAVDLAESEPALAMAINGVAPGVLAVEAKQLGCGLIHYSTDYVFDGAQSQSYVETDLPNPQSVYGQTKLMGEQAIAASGCAHLILRTSWVYGLRGKNFLLTMLRLGQEREELKVVADQYGAPTWCRMLAATTGQIVAQGSSDIAGFLQERSGVYHVTAAGQTSWYGFAEAIFQLVQAERQLQRLIPIATTDYPTPARRPAFSSLAVGKFERVFDLALPTWQRSLALDQDN
jgi:dTDP-4-dehydrorhamnose reductase